MEQKTPQTGRCAYRMFGNGNRTQVIRDDKIVGSASRRKDARSDGYVYSVHTLAGVAVYHGSKMSEGLSELTAVLDRQPALANNAGAGPTLAVETARGERGHRVEALVRIGEFTRPEGTPAASNVCPKANVYAGPYYIGDLWDVGSRVDRPLYRMFYRAALKGGEGDPAAQPICEDFGTITEFLSSFGKARS